jgi:hypothetical protein
MNTKYQIMELHCGSGLPCFLRSIFGERLVIKSVLTQESCHPGPILQRIMYQTDVNGGIIVSGLRVFAICKISQVNCESSFFFRFRSSSLTGGSSMVRSFGWSNRSSYGQLNPPNNLLSRLNRNVPLKSWRVMLWPFGLVKVLLVPALHLDKPERPQALTFKHSLSRMLLHLLPAGHQTRGHFY